MNERTRLSSIGLELWVAGCPNACRHCKDSGRPPCGALMSLADAKWVTESLKTAAPGCPVEPCVYHEFSAHPDCVELLRYCAENTGDASATFAVLATNGYGIAQAENPQKLLEGLSGLGVRKLSFTLHGLAQHHDWFISRPGAYQDIWTAAGLAVEAGLRTFFSIYLDRENVPDWGPLRDRIAAFSGRTGYSVGTCVEIPGYCANDRARKYESRLRPRLGDLKPIAAQLAEL